MLTWSSISTSFPNSFAPAKAPSTMSRLIADAKMMMKTVDSRKYAINVHRAAASRQTSSMLAQRTFIGLAASVLGGRHGRPCRNQRRHGRRTPWSWLCLRCFDQINEHVFQRRAHRRELAEHSAARAQTVDQRIEVRQIVHRQHQMAVHALHSCAALAEHREQRVVDRSRDHLVLLRPPR